MAKLSDEDRTAQRNERINREWAEYEEWHKTLKPKVVSEETTRNEQIASPKVYTEEEKRQLDEDFQKSWAQLKMNFYEDDKKRFLDYQNRSFIMRAYHFVKEAVIFSAVTFIGIFIVALINVILEKSGHQTAATATLFKIVLFPLGLISGIVTTLIRRRLYTPRMPAPLKPEIIEILQDDEKQKSA
ncbi:MAG: hypothetical protein IPM97_00215 [Bdellovibrionaceae bacterium]|nr:hypothetical protein [Pseudobdellovibrionaceae bacterium]